MPTIVGESTRRRRTLLASRKLASRFASCQFIPSSSDRGATSSTSSSEARHRSIWDQRGQDSSSAASAASPVTWTWTAVTPADCMSSISAVVRLFGSNSVFDPKTWSASSSLAARRRSSARNSSARWRSSSSAKSLVSNARRQPWHARSHPRGHSRIRRLATRRSGKASASSPT